MSTQSRRTFLATAALAAAAHRLHAQGCGSLHANLVLPIKSEGAHVPCDFVGLSYEIQELANPSFFSPSNAGLITAFKEVSAHGVLRLGGNMSEFGYWKAAPDAPEPKHPGIREAAGEPKAQYYAVTPEAIQNLASFLKATGWSCIYGVGMGTNSPERAAEEASYVTQRLGSLLEYFQIGNEADIFSRHLRDPKTWTPAAYMNEWLAFARAIAARSPEARFGLPDVASKIDWLTTVAELWPTIENPPRIATLSHHHYFSGPASNPNVNIANILKPETALRVQETANTASRAAAKMGVRVRMTEGNTCYRGGKPGVSDVFAAALWAADYALLLASNNYSGINLHGGNGKSVANSVGGSLPGDVLLKEQRLSDSEIASHPHPFYTPIGVFGTKYELQPVAYGLKFAGLFAGAIMLKTDFAASLESAGANVSAFAARLANGKLAVIAINKDASRDLTLTIDFGTTTARGAGLSRLVSSSLTSREAQILTAPRPAIVRHGKTTVVLPHGSGLCLTLG